MASETSIINNALRELGGTRITSRTDGSTNANIANDVYDDVRQQCLRNHHWNFAIARKKLAKKSDSPVFGYDDQWSLPSDYIRTVRVYDNNEGTGTVPYRLEGDTLHSDAEDIYLEYVKDVEDPNLMDPSFRFYFEMALAAKMAIAVTNSRGVKEDMEDERDKKFRQAKAADAIENYPDEQQDGSWVDDRSR